MSETTRKWTKLISGAVKFLPEAGWVGIVVELLTQLAVSMGATSGDSKEALAHIEALKGDLARITAANAGISQQLSAQAEAAALHSEKLDAVSAEVHSTQLTVDSIKDHLTRLEARSDRLFFLLAILFLLSFFMILASLILLTVILLHLRHTP